MRRSIQTWGTESGAALPVALEVLRRGPISRADIGRRLGLSHASLSRLSAPLIERGVIFDVGERNNGKVGRPSRLLDVDASSHHFLGIKIREREVVCAVTDLRGEVRDSTTVALAGQDSATVVDQIRAVHRHFAADRTITGIGIGLGGAVRGRRVVTNARFLGWRKSRCQTSSKRLHKRRHSSKTTSSPSASMKIGSDSQATTNASRW